jgi:glycosyltransferase involved in cell wall biosynthesis
MRWNSKEVTCEASVREGVWESVHLSGFRLALTDATLVLTTQALSGIPVRERRLLFEYAQRQGLRVICILRSSHTPGSALDPAVFLADAILCEDAGVRNRLLQELQADCAPAASVPPIGTLVPHLDLRSELITLPSLAILPPVKRRSTVLDCVRQGEGNLATPSRVAWLDPASQSAGGGGGRGDHDWVMLPLAEGEGIGLAGQLQRGPGTPDNVAVLVLGEALRHLDDRSCLLELELLAKSARIIVFEEASSYRSFFETCCRLDAAIAILRHKSVLLSQHPDNDAFERLARCLRLKGHPRRSGDAAPRPSSASPAASSGVILSVCVSTYNRADWLRVTLPLIARETAQWKDHVELLVVDNASTDGTDLIAEELAEHHSFKYHRNERNVGMLGNLGMCAKHMSGDYIWILGDDDIVKPGAVSLILEAIARHPATELVYLNYAYTHFDTPEELRDVTELMARATPIAEPTASGFYPHIWQMAALNENFFTSIFACIFRRDHGLGAYTQYTDFPPFSNMQSAIPTTKYVLANMMDRPGYWIGTPEVVVNMNVSWARYSPVWHIERFPEVFDLAEANGVSEADLRRYREANLGQALHFLKELSRDDKYVSGLLSLTRYIESMKRTPGFRRHVDELLHLYQRHLVQPEGRPAKRLAAPALRALYNLRSVRD